MTSQDISSIISNKKWDDLPRVCGSSLKSLFAIISKDDSQKDFFQQIPDETLIKLLNIDPSKILQCMIKFYDTKYHQIALKLLNSNLYNSFCDQLISLLDQSSIISALQSIIPIRFLENENENYIFYRHAITGKFSYTSLTPKIIRSSQNLKYCPINWLSILLVSRKDILPALKELLIQIFTYCNELDSTTVKPILKCAFNIYSNSDPQSQKVLLTTFTNFKYPKVFQNTLCSCFLETKGESEFNFFQLIGLSKSSELYFIPECIKEMNDSFDSKSSQSILRTASLKIFSSNKNNLYFHKKILMIKHYQYIDNHPLQNAWNYMIKYLKESIIKEIIQTGRSENLVNIISNLFYDPKSATPNYIEKVTLSYDESIEIIETSINTFISKKNEICSIDPQRYTNFLLLIMSNLVGTYCSDFKSSKYLYKSSDLFRSALTFISNEVRDKLIKEALFDPLSSSNFTIWAQNAFHSDVIGLALRISNIDEISKLFPLNIKEHKNDINENNNQIEFDKIEFDEFSFSKNEISFTFNDRLTLKGYFSFVELFIFLSSFWNSNSQRIYSDAVAILQKFLNIQQVIAISTKDKKRLERAYQLNLRLIQILMLNTSEAQNTFRFGFLSEVFTHPYSLAVGSLYKSTQEFSDELIQLIERFPCTISDPFNLPFRIAVNLIQNSFCEELPSISEVAEKVTEKCLEICVNSFSSFPSLEENDANSEKLKTLFDISDSVCSVRNLFSSFETLNKEEIKKDHYKDFIKQYFNSIDSAAAKFNHISLNLHDESYQYYINYENGWTLQVIPPDAFKNYEQMIKTPSISSGSGLNASLSFIYKQLTQMNENKKDIKNESPYFVEFRNKLCQFLCSEINKIKKFSYCIEPLIENDSILFYQYENYLKFHSNEELILTPPTSHLISALIGNKRYETIIGESDIPIVFIDCLSNVLKNQEEIQNETFWKEVKKIIQILSENQTNNRIQSNNCVKEKPYFKVKPKYFVKKNIEDHLLSLFDSRNNNYNNYIKDKISQFKNSFSQFQNSFNMIKENFGLNLPIINEKEKIIDSLLNGMEFNKKELFDKLDEKNQELNSSNFYESAKNYAAEIDKQKCHSLLKIIANISDQNWDLIDLNSLNSILLFLKEFSLYSDVHSNEIKTVFPNIQKFFTYILKRAIQQIGHEQSILIIQELSKYQMKFDLSIIEKPLDELFEKSTNSIQNNINSAQGIITIIIKSINEDILNDSLNFDNNFGVKLLYKCFLNSFFSKSHFVYFSYKEESIITQELLDFNANRCFNDNRFQKLLDFYEEFILKSIENKTIVKLPCHLITDVVIKCLESIPMNEKETNFVLKSSEQKLNCEISRYFLSTIALHLNYQYFYGMQPTQTEILIQSMKNVYNQNQEAMIAFLGQLIDSKNAKEAIENHEKFSQYNQSPQNYISKKLSKRIDLQFPRTEEWEEFFGDVALEFMCSALKSSQTHINELSIRVLGAISSSNDKISAKIAPFITQQMSQYENEKNKTTNFMIKFAIQFILHHSNSKYNEAIDSVINLIPIIAKNFNIVAKTHFSEMMLGEDGFKWIDQETVIYKILENAFDDAVKDIFEDKSESIGEKQKQELLYIHSIANKMKNVLNANSDNNITHPIVNSANFLGFNGIVQILSDNNFIGIGESKSEPESLTYLIKLLVNNSAILNLKIPNCIQSIFEFYIDEFSVDHMRLLSKLSGNLAPFKNVLLMLKEAIVMSLQLIDKNEFALLIPNLSLFIAIQPENQEKFDQQKENDNDQKNSDKINIFVKGLDGKTLPFTVSQTNTIADIKELINKAIGIPCDQTRLIYSGKQLEDSNKIQDYEIHPNSTIHMVLRLRGG